MGEEFTIGAGGDYATTPLAFSITSPKTYRCPNGHGVTSAESFEWWFQAGEKKVSGLVCTLCIGEYVLAMFPLVEVVDG
jgi:hypothetical protein